MDKWILHGIFVYCRDLFFRSDNANLRISFENFTCGLDYGLFDGISGRHPIGTMNIGDKIDRNLDVFLPDNRKPIHPVPGHVAVLDVFNILL